MESIEVALGDAAKVRDIVFATLAERDRLRQDDLSLAERPLLRDGQLCGVHFALRGPREVLLTAIWDAAAGTLWFYDSRGVRFARTAIAK